MADPLRRTLLAKLRGKKAKKGASVGGGCGSAAAAEANGGREGKEKVLHTQQLCDAAPPVMLFSSLECATERMSTYENCVDGAAVHAGGSLALRDSRAADSAGARFQERSSGGRGRVNEPLAGVSLQRGAEREGRGFGEADGSRRGAELARTVEAAQLHGKPFVSVPRQRSAGDSIGFGDNSNHVSHRARAESHTGVRPSSQHRVPTADGDGTEPGSGAPSRHMAAAAVAERERNDNWTLDNSATDGALAHPSVEEHVFNRNIESCELELAGGLQRHTFFPTELEICDITLCAAEASLRFPVDSDDEDYYDNEILPFYGTIREKSGGDRAGEDLMQPVEDKGPLGDSSSAQETHRLRNQLKEAYYLLINAMNDISLDAQHPDCGLAEQQATSSCSSHSRDSLCSRLSAKNMDSVSWSSGGDHSPQQVSDTDSLLLCHTGELSSGLGSLLRSKSMLNLSFSKIRPTLSRSASDGAIRYSASIGTQGPRERSPGPCDDKEAPETGEAAVRAVGQSGTTACGRKEDGGGLNESSGSVNSLTGSSDGSSNRGHGGGRGPGGVRARGADPLNKGHGVTVNKMQEWMHRGRLLSSEMKQRIEGPARPRGPERCCSQGCGGSKTSSRGAKAAKSKSPTVKVPREQQQPAFIENVCQSPCAHGREVGKTNEPSSWRPPLTTITVSKKRNWLQQSALGKTNCTKEDLQGISGAEEEANQGSHQAPPPPSPSPDHLRPAGGAPLRQVRLQLPQITVGQVRVSPHSRTLDPAEENDADDEGEIWYNPIPEDDESCVSHRPSVCLVVPPRADPQRRPSRGGDASHKSPDCNGGPGPEAFTEGFAGGSGDGSQGNAIHSTEALHLHRQMLACKSQEEGGPCTSKATDCPDLPNAASFSPPSSPNPTKKSSSITWSFPDKIKSPRTVRKISMKMKKLPELSRKLSVKGTLTSNQLEPRARSPRNNGNGSDAVLQTSGPPRLAASGGGQASRNVISRYHLDSSVSTQHSFSKKKSNGSSKSASKGGYLSDGDSPELVAKSGKHGSAEGKGGKGKDTEGGGSSKINGSELDIDAFRHYSFTEQPKCSQYISGLMSLHFYGAEDLKPPRIDSRDVYCAIQVDSVNKARTALLTCRTTFLDMDHTFNIELENAQHLKLVVFSWEPTPRRNRVCCHGTVVLPALFRVTRSHQLAVKLEPRGLIYVKLSLMEQWQNSLDGGPDGDREPQVFGVEAWKVVERENTGLMVPLLISKCINEIEKRGCQVVGLYRLCGSAAVKKELREAFERDSHAVELCENTYPDINVITGVLKDYLRELPHPLITKQLYEAVLESMGARPLRMGAAGCENDQADAEHTVGLLEHLPEVERVTLKKLLDHLKLVASYQDVNKMTCQNLAVCFGPVLLSQRQEASTHSNRVFIDSEELASALHFKKHIEVLHYLLQLWPVVDPYAQFSGPQTPAASLDVSSAPIRRRKERPQVLNFTEAEMAGVLRPKAGRLDSPSNRYAGDWSGCGESYFHSEMTPPPSKEEADYDDVPSEDAEAAEEVAEKPEDAEGDGGQEATSPNPAEQEPLPKEEAVMEKENEEQEQSDDRRSLKDEKDERPCEHILPPRLPKEHTYQAYMKIQDISPVLGNRVNLRDLQESIDTLIGNLERELNKNKLNVGY